MRLPIATNRLLLRQLRHTDIDPLFFYRNDPDVARYQDWETFSREEAIGLIRGAGEFSVHRHDQWQQLGIGLAPDDILIGDVGVLVSSGGRSAELGFTVARQYHRNGIAREAVSAVIAALFEGPEIRQLDARTDARNHGANRLLSRLGFELRSTLDTVFKGAPCREHVYLLSRTEYLASRYLALEIDGPRRRREP